MLNTEKFIPVSDLPEGIILCLKNSDRHYQDSQILNEKKHYPSAISNLMLACEELVKAKLLMMHFKDKKPVTKNEIKRYFREHEFRLDEFEKYFDDTVPNYPEWAKNIKGRGKRQQDFKEKMTYVDWNGYRWLDPLHHDDLQAISDESEIETRLKNIYFVTRESFAQVWNALLHDPLIEEIKLFPKSDKPTKLKVIQLAKDILNPFTIHVSIRVTDSKIQINVDPNYNNPKEVKQELKKRLRERFPKSNIEIKITKDR